MQIIIAEKLNVNTLLVSKEEFIDLVKDQTVMWFVGCGYTKEQSGNDHDIILPFRTTDSPLGKASAARYVINDKADNGSIMYFGKYIDSPKEIKNFKGEIYTDFYIRIMPFEFREYFSKFTGNDGINEVKTLFIFAFNPVKDDAKLVIQAPYDNSAHINNRILDLKYMIKTS